MSAQAIYDHLFLLSLSLHKLVGRIDVEVKEDPPLSTVWVRLRGTRFCRQCESLLPRDLLREGLCPACLRGTLMTSFKLEAYLYTLRTYSGLDVNVILSVAMIALSVAKNALVLVNRDEHLPSGMFPVLLRVRMLETCGQLIETDEYRDFVDKVRRLFDSEPPDLLDIVYHLGILLLGCSIFGEKTVAEAIRRSLGNSDLAAVIGGERAWDKMMAILALSDINLVLPLIRWFGHKVSVASDANSVLLSVGDTRICNCCGFIVSAKEPRCRICAIHKPPASLWRMEESQLSAWLLELIRLTKGSKR